MKRSEFNDEQIEKLLRKLPKVEDHRNPQEIFHNVSIQLNIQKKRRTWLVPTIATALAALLFIILIPTIFNNGHDIAYDHSMAESTELQEIGMTSTDEKLEKFENHEEMERSMATEDGNHPLMTPLSIASYNAVYEEDVSEDEVVITLNIPDQNVQNVVPVSFIVPKEDMTLLEQVEVLSNQIDEEALGLIDFYPLQGKLFENNNELIVDVPVDHNYHIGTNSYLFLKAIDKIGELVEKHTIQLQTEGESGIDLGNYGKLETYTIDTDKNHAYFFYFPSNQEKPYLVPSPEPFANIDKAIKSMKEKIETYDLYPSIPENLNFTSIREEGKRLILTLANDERIPDSSTFIESIEAILLTAKQFNFSEVIIESNILYQFGKFSFNEVWQVPLAPNKEVMSN